MNRPSSGEKAPEFCLPDSDEEQVCLNEYRGKWLILYFYPKDNTSGCTLEAVTFTRFRNDFESLNARIVGVSPDSPGSHCSFRDKHNLGIRLLSDSGHEALRKYGVWVLKKMYGREYYGVERTTFLIDPQGVIRTVWNKVSVKGHAEEVLDTLKSLKTD